MMLHHGELLDVRVPVQAYNRQAWQIFAEVAADSRDPGAVNEAKIIVWVGSEPLDQLGRRPFEGFRLRPQRLPAVRLPSIHGQAPRAPRQSEGSGGSNARRLFSRPPVRGLGRNRRVCNPALGPLALQ